MAIIATGMVLVIVSRNIDLSVGSIVGVIAMTYALMMTDWLPSRSASASDIPLRGSSHSPSGWRSGRSSARFQGFIIAYIGVPSFIVTLGGLLSSARLVWLLSAARPSPACDPTFQLIGGGAAGLDRRAR